ncbi:hypothetical protein V501_05441 [Pseudogymnoascus sp. VKM F-4519 (FW-2642)]|uniref:Cell division control protein 14 n=1 Tax=Pseudogymnoascus verrucosus TaxID=342668 RepID=A0A1B8G8U0_9PEZI|nr:uncharacterized protein VE01_09978 [Pseudogymnoascus verrucosus]KFY76462.1 hypothetical protein V499_03884 [Pseudogymnoascus sp. VKM F-103]KFZ09907.1 hypothetical protein V501_05441 [Pseudogymnoascus sp. VKM F-4519 (FW-2642)]OBT92245.1 hypothetical protein VE01_09978 [Pseudogymnoascus verrucosus]
MEALLSLSFDNLSSYDASKIRKGMRQVEGLLAQICLSKHKPNKRHSLLVPADNPPPSPRKELADLPDDPAFREFFKLQDGFEWNVALRLVNCLDRLLGKSNDGQNDLLILACLDLIQGILLLHPSSRSLFSRELYMNHLLDLLEPINCPAIQSATLLTLVVVLLDTPANTRTFEALDGLLTVTSLFKSRSTPRDVKAKLVEFLYFYLLPESPSIPSAGARDSVPAMLQRSPSKLAGAFGREMKGRGEPAAEVTRSPIEKQALVSRHLSSVEDLVEDLRDSAPFGGIFS